MFSRSGWICRAHKLPPCKCIQLVFLMMFLYARRRMKGTLRIFLVLGAE